MERKTFVLPLLLVIDIGIIVQSECRLYHQVGNGVKSRENVIKSC